MAVVRPTDHLAQTAERADFYSFTRSALADFLRIRFDLPSFRAVQLFKWVYGKGETRLAEMTDIKRELRESLGLTFSFPAAEVRSLQVSSDGTRKFLFALGDGAFVEAVLVKQPDRNTLCVSSQLGCAMGCTFCRTGTMRFQRNLTTSEIIQQVLTVRADALARNESVHNVVFMGMGEPLHNFEAVAAAADILADQQGLNFSTRRITVSTSGLVSRIKQFNASGVKASLAVSLNATTDEVRTRIMPVNKKYPIAELLGALREFKVKRNRRITIEYVLLAGVNDTDEDLRRLPALLRGLPVKVNLVPYNENAGMGFECPSRARVEEWADRLRGKGIDTTIRWSKGADIQAACGQLATSAERHPQLLKIK